MKNYSSNRVQKGKTAYRTPSLYRANKAYKNTLNKVLSPKNKFSNSQFKVKT